MATWTEALGDIEIANVETMGADGTYIYWAGQSGSDVKVYRWQDGDASATDISTATLNSKTLPGNLSLLHFNGSMFLPVTDAGDTKVYRYTNPGWSLVLTITSTSGNEWFGSDENNIVMLAGNDTCRYSSNGTSWSTYTLPTNYYHSFKSQGDSKRSIGGRWYDNTDLANTLIYIEWTGTSFTERGSVIGNAQYWIENISENYNWSRHGSAMWHFSTSYTGFTAPTVATFEPTPMYGPKCVYDVCIPTSAANVVAYYFNGTAWTASETIVASTSASWAGYAVQSDNYPYVLIQSGATGKIYKRDVQAASYTYSAGGLPGAII